MPFKIAILASGNGTNAENIAKHFANSDMARVVVALTDRRDAYVSKRMEKLGIDTYYVPGNVWKENPDKIASFLSTQGVDIIVLAGFLRYVSPEILKAFPGRVLNLHPSLLPKFGGKGMWGHKVHEAVVAAGEKKSGATVHLVTEEMDSGEIVLQQEVEVTSEDTPETLEAKVHEVEYELYPKAIEKLVNEVGSNNEQMQKWANVLGVEYAQPATPPPLPPMPPVVELSKKEKEASEAPQEEAVMPPTYLIWCILMIIFCCAPAAIVALIYSIKVSNRWFSGDYAGSRHASTIVERWLIASFAIGVIEATFFVPMWLLSGM